MYDICNSNCGSSFNTCNVTITPVIIILLRIYQFYTSCHCFKLWSNLLHFRLAYTYLENLSGCVPTLTVAVRLSRLLRCFAVKADSNELSVKTGKRVFYAFYCNWLTMITNHEEAWQEGFQCILVHAHR